MRRFLTKLTVCLLLLLPIFATGVTQPALAQQSDAPRWTIADQRDIDVDGTLVSLSPDGNWLAGIGPDQEFCIWAVEDLAATCETTENPPLAASFAWAPDSSAIAWSSDAARLMIDSDIMLFDIASMTLNNLTDSPDEPKRVSFNNDGVTLMDVFPVWSPDSRRIMFIRGAFGGERPTTQIMELDPQTGDVDLYFVIPGTELLSIYSLMFFQPDGSLLVAVHPVKPESGVHGIWRITPDGGSIEKVLDSGKNSEFPFALMTSISADGSRIALMSLAAFGLPPEEQHPYALLDLATGDLTMFDDDDLVLSGTASFGGPADQLIIPSIGPSETGRTITIGSDPLDGTFPAEVLVGGANWAANNTMLLPYDSNKTGIAGVLLTLSSETTGNQGDGDRMPPTPKPPCSCTPPRD